MHTVTEYQGYLSELSRRLVAANVKASILLFGGGALAMRIDPKHPDKNDIIFLIKHLELCAVDEVLTLIDRYLPSFKNEITQRHKDYLAVFITEAQQQ
jgi:hypothetical protein